MGNGMHMAKPSKLPVWGLKNSLFFLDIIWAFLYQIIIDENLRHQHGGDIGRAAEEGS
jgi:hypothetical protein